MPAVAGYSHVAICVADVEASKHFYGEQLGLVRSTDQILDSPAPGT